jgi:2-dehydropantoate 2-reductase
MMQINVLGTGAMACLFAAKLAKVARVALIGTWAEAINAIRERGVILEESSGTQSIRIEAEFLGDPIPPADLVIVLVKSWQTEKIAGYLSGYLSPQGSALSLQNGLGNREILGSKAFPGTTAEGATLLGPGHVLSGGSGPTHIVAPNRIVELFRSAGFESYGCALAEAESLIWGKLAISCGINALTALLRVRNGELLERADASDLMERAALECASVAQSKGIKLPFSDPVAQVREVALKTSNNRSSMLQDILRGAPTECEAINGAVVREGSRLNVATPVNDVLRRLVCAVSQENRSY